MTTIEFWGRVRGRRFERTAEISSFGSRGRGFKETEEDTRIWRNVII